MFIHICVYYLYRANEREIKKGNLFETKEKDTKTWK